LLHLANIKKIDGPMVVMSGINNLTRSLMSGSFSPVFGAFFQQFLFEAAMARSTIGRREVVKRSVSNFFKKLRGSELEYSDGERVLNGSFYRPMLEIFERDCRMIQVISQAHNTSASFIVQPFIPWLNKELAIEESRLFSLLDQESADFTPILSELADYQSKYRDDLHQICKSVGMKFYDANDSNDLKGKEWLFVDRAHFTDEGNLAMSKLIVQYLEI